MFSRVNQFSLSTEYLETIAESVQEDSVAFYSNFSSVEDSEFDLPYMLKIQSEKQQFNWNFHGIFGTEGELPSLSNFGAVGSNISYVSPFMKSGLEVSVFTTKHPEDSLPVENNYPRFYPSLSSEHIEGSIDFNFLLNQAWLEFYYKDLSVTVGKKKFRWGPGYKGSLALSGTSFSPFYYYYLNYTVGKLFNISSFLAGYEDEAMYSSEVSNSQVHYTVDANGMTIKSLPARYTAGHRVDFRFGDRVQLGVYELVTFFGSGELNRFANPLQIYYFGNDASGTNNGNLLGGIDFNVVLNSARIYGEFLNDDITVFEKTGNPNKYAFQLGTAFYPEPKWFVTAGAEYLHIEPYVYGHSRVLSRYSTWGTPVGWNYGNDQDIVTLYGRFKPMDNLEVRTELNYWILGEGRVKNDWFSDGTPNMEEAPFLPEHPEHLTTVQIGATYKPLEYLTLDITARPKWFDGDLSADLYGYVIADIPNLKTITEIE